VLQVGGLLHCGCPRMVRFFASNSRSVRGMVRCKGLDDRSFAWITTLGSRDIGLTGPADGSPPFSPAETVQFDASRVSLCGLSGVWASLFQVVSVRVLGTCPRKGSRLRS